MNYLSPEVPFDPMALAGAIDRLKIATMIPHAAYMPAPLDHEYALLRYRCAHLNFRLKKVALVVVEMLLNIKGDE